jgi:hypothetical protein
MDNNISDDFFHRVRLHLKQFSPCDSTFWQNLCAFPAVVWPQTAA